MEGLGRGLVLVLLSSGGGAVPLMIALIMGEDRRAWLCRLGRSVSDSSLRSPLGCIAGDVAQGRPRPAGHCGWFCNRGVI